MKQYMPVIAILVNSLIFGASTFTHGTFQSVLQVLSLGIFPAMIAVLILNSHQFSYPAKFGLLVSIIIGLAIAENIGYRLQPDIVGPSGQHASLYTYSAVYPLVAYIHSIIVLGIGAFFLARRRGQSTPKLATK